MRDVSYGRLTELLLAIAMHCGAANRARTVYGDLLKSTLSDEFYYMHDTIIQFILIDIIIMSERDILFQTYFPVVGNIGE